MVTRRLLTLLILMTAGTCAVAALALLQWLPFPRAEFASGEWIARYGRRQPADPKLIFLEIDNSSMLDPELDVPDYLRGVDPASSQAEALRCLSEKWPWSRRIYGLILDRMVAAGAKVVVFDLNFPTPTPDDPAFRAALERHRTHVVIGANFVMTTREKGQPAAEYVRPAETVLPLAAQRDARLGFANIWPEADGVVRSATYTMTQAELDDYRPLAGEEQHFSLAAQAVRQAGGGNLLPADSTPRTLRFVTPGGFTRRSLYEIFAPDHWQRNCGSGALFRDAVVVVGSSGNWLQDEHLTTLGVLPGPEIQLDAINAALHGGFIRTMTPVQLLAAIALAGLYSALATLLVAAPLWRLALLVAGPVAWVGGALLAYNHLSTLLPTAAPLLALGLNGASGLLYDFAATRRERRRVRSTLERYVSRNVVREMIENPAQYTQVLGGAVRPVTVLFSDIRNFTRHCANADPHALVEQLNEYLTAMVHCVFTHGGTLDKFIGDAVMVVWGNARTDGPEQDARQGVRCALAMQVALDELNARWMKEGRRPMAIGIALNHGRVVVGNIGSPHRMEFTVMGDAVNVSWRLQERTKIHSGEILLGESMLPLLGEEFGGEILGSIIVGETLEVPYARLLVKQNSQPVKAGCKTAEMAGAR